MHIPAFFRTVCVVMVVFSSTFAVTTMVSAANTNFTNPALESFLNQCSKPRAGCLAQYEGAVYTIKPVGKNDVRFDIVGNLYTITWKGNAFREDGKYIKIISQTDPDYEKWLRAFVTGL